MTFIEELKWRNLFKDCTDEESLNERMNTPMSMYCGYDPTADSLHIGHLQQLILLKRYQAQGHHPIALIGGGTGMIGDPRPTSERALLSDEAIKHNAEAIGKQIKYILRSQDNAIRIINNADWLEKINLISFLRDYGKYFSVNTMIAKDTIAKRLESGISFTEFSYTILQAIDWYQLYKNYGCEMQIGGSDQWGNLVSGTDLIRKIVGSDTKVYGVTSPLITKADGTKFGKSEGVNIWLDPQRTSSYSFYQYLINTADADTEDYLKRLSMRSVEDLEALFAQARLHPEQRLGQKALAQELTLLVHGEAGLSNALLISDILFSGEIQRLSKEQIDQAFALSDVLELTEDRDLVSVMVECGSAKSKREARELLQNGSIFVNGERVQSLDCVVTQSAALYGVYTILRKGKKHYFMIKHAA